MSTFKIAGFALVTTMMLHFAMGTVFADKLSSVSGRVVDQEGNPVKGATVAVFWDVKDGTLHARKWSGVMRTNKKGEFKGKARVFPRGSNLFAIDKHQKRGAIIRVSESETQNLLITLEPLVAITGRCEIEKLDLNDLDKFWVDFGKDGGIGNCRMQNGAFTYKLPPGDYDLRINARQTEAIIKQFTVTSGSDSYDLGTFNLELNTIWRHVGKQPPEISITDARGISKDITWESFKGKWVLFEFWGYW